MYFYHLRLEILPPTSTPASAKNVDLAGQVSLPTSIFEPLLPSYKASGDQVSSSVALGKSPSSEVQGIATGQGRVPSLVFGSIGKSYNSSKDWRQGKLQIEWIDFAKMPEGGEDKKKQKAHTVPTSGAFVPYRFGTTELDAGTLHLYRDRSEVEDILTAAALPVDATATNTSATQTMADMKGTGTILCVLAVPSYMTAQDFLNFVGSSQDDMSHLRIVKDSLPNRFMVLIKFREEQGGARFYHRFNGREFSSMEPEICHVVYIKSIEFKSQAIPPYAFPPLPDDPSSLSPSHVAPHQLLELPTCPVCLERMDAAVTGLLTIFCHHTFHCNCLAKWADSSCPVCRYSSNASMAESEDDMPNECMDCGSTLNLWICLICGNIGCGRYQEGHAQSHFADTHHTYSMELETQRVWDYAGDGYVHRLIQNRTDGKLVELPAPTRNHSTEFAEANQQPASVPTDGTAVSTAKMESISMEYSYLLTSQLESQRLWYESKLSQIENTLLQQQTEWDRSLKQIRDDCAMAVMQREDLATRLAIVEKGKRMLESKLSGILERAVKSEKNLQEERALNGSLLTNQASYQEKIATLERSIVAKDIEIQELNEQLRDVMVFLDVRNQVEEDGAGDMKGAEVVGVAPAPPTPGSRKKGKGKKS
ncbi:zf-UBP-domain-containing protein [Phlyctochytrium arcticum]|nr:zf-UBP-domain-containing protein [Phlyctochytrium arcticum]